MTLHTVWSLLTLQLFHVPILLIVIVLRYGRRIVGVLANMTGVIR